MTAQSPKKKKKKAKKRSSSSTMTPSSAAVQAATSVAAVSPGRSCFPYAVRSQISAKFFSLLSEHVHYTVYGASDESAVASLTKEARMYKILRDIVGSCKTLEAAGAKRYSTPEYNENDGDAASNDMDTSTSLESTIDAFQKRVKKTNADVHSAREDKTVDTKNRLATGVANLALVLYLHQLRSGTSADTLDDDDPDASDEDDDAEIKNAIEHLHDILDRFLTLDGSRENPLLQLAESCANILSSPLSTGNSTRGASPRLLRETIKLCWLGGLAMSKCLATEESNLFDDQVADILLEAIGAPRLVGSNSNDGDDDMDVDEAADENDSADADGESAGSDEGVFTKAIGIINDSGEDSEQESDSENGNDGTNRRDASDGDGSNDGSNSDSDVELDSSKLQFMLEEDSDAGVDTDVLEHHEGADGALARLIKLKQDMRKAGTQARERIETANQLRCTLLLELAFHRLDKTQLIRRELLLKLLLPILQHRRNVERSIEKLSGKSAAVSVGEKNALVDRLSSLIKSSLSKIRLSSLPSSIGQKEYTEVRAFVVSQLIELAKKSESKEQLACCSYGLVLALRGISCDNNDEDDGDASIAELLKNHVRDWSTKRAGGGSKLDTTTVFEVLIGRLPSVAAQVLSKPLIDATQQSRSPYLKCESYRLLLMLYTHSRQQQDATAGVSQALHKHRQDAVRAFAATLRDDDSMRKTKILRVVLKALEKFVTTDDGDAASLQPLGEALQNVASSISVSKPMKNMTKKIAEVIDSKMVEFKQREAATVSVPKSPPTDQKKKKGKKK